MLLFHLQLGLVCLEIHLFVEYSPSKCFKSIAQSVVDAKRQKHKNRNSSVVAKTVNRLAEGSHRYKIKERSGHTVLKYLSDDETRAVIGSKLFNKLDHVNDSKYEAELTELHIEQTKLLFVALLFLEYGKLRAMEPCYNLSTKISDVNKLEDLEMDTDSPYIALAQK